MQQPGGPDHESIRDSNTANRAGYESRASRYSDHFKLLRKRALASAMFQGKMMVVAQGGKIEVESEARKGSTFRVLLASDKQVR